MPGCEVHYNEKKNQFQIKGLTGNILSIPSSMLPLKGSKPLRMFTYDNTSECSDPAVLAALSKFKPQIGRCYRNSRSLFNLLCSSGVDPSRIRTYVSWTIFGNIPGFPVHHCITVIDDMHVIDIISRVPSDISQDEYVSLMAKHTGHYSTELYGTGKVQKHICHIAKECSPEDAMKQRESLEARYPNHPAFRTIKNGYTETQRAIIEKTIAERTV